MSRFGGGKNTVEAKHLMKLNSVLLNSSYFDVTSKLNNLINWMTRWNDIKLRSLNIIGINWALRFDQQINWQWNGNNDFIPHFVFSFSITCFLFQFHATESNEVNLMIIIMSLSLSLFFPDGFVILTTTTMWMLNNFGCYWANMIQHHYGTWANRAWLHRWKSNWVK